MDEFKWILISLFLMEVFHFIAGKNQTLILTVRDGANVTLPCANVINGQQKCDRTTWLFINETITTEVELVTLGQTGGNAGAESNRLSVTEDCSLHIKRVTKEDVGFYTCQQFKSGKKQSPDALICLSLLTITEQKNTDSVTLRCSVSTYRVCRYKLNWLYEGKGVDHHGVTLFLVGCYAFITLRTDHHMYKSRLKLLQCEATIENNALLFPFELQPSDEDMRIMTEVKTTNQIKTTTTEITESTMTTENNIEEAGRWRFIVVSVGLSALIITVVTVNIWTKIKGNKTQKDEKQIDVHELVDTVNYENITPQES